MKIPWRSDKMKGNNTKSIKQADTSFVRKVNGAEKDKFDSVKVEKYGKARGEH